MDETFATAFSLSSHAIAGGSPVHLKRLSHDRMGEIAARAPTAAAPYGRLPAFASEIQLLGMTLDQRRSIVETCSR
jgi:NADPH-dependent 2,4-dienoyl-CoA reductase/sulfur reductase-like enzyme